MMKVYSAQQQVVLDTIRESDIYHVKREFITQKYEDVADVMLYAYNWFTKQMQRRIDKPLGAEYPVWHSVESKYLFLGEGVHLIELCIPDSEVLLFDNHGWERVLQMNYVGIDFADEQDFDDMLRNKGITTGSEAIFSPHYPFEKQNIIKSWSRIFDITSSKAIRGATWQVKKAWIKKII